MKPILAALMLLAPSASFARIGETQEECAKRYGQEAKRESGKDWQTIGFSKGGVLTTCFFAEGKCASLIFSIVEPVRVDFRLGALPRRFTPEQEEKLLAANAGGSTWELEKGDEYVRTMKTADGKRFARLSAGSIIIQTYEDMERRGALVLPEAISKAIEGF